MKRNHLVKSNCTLFSILLGITPVPLLAEEFIDIGSPKLHKGRYECPNGESSTMPFSPDIWWSAIKLVPSSSKSNEYRGPFNVVLNPELSTINTTVWMGKKTVLDPGISLSKRLDMEVNVNKVFNEIVINYKELSNDKSFAESQGIKTLKSNKIKINAKNNQLADRFDAPGEQNGPPVIDYIFPLKNDEGKTFDLTYKGMWRRRGRGYYLTDAKGKEYSLVERGFFERDYNYLKLSCVGIKNKPNYSKMSLKQRQDAFLVTFNQFEEGYQNGAYNAIPILIEHNFIFDTIKFKGENYQAPSF